MDLLKEQIMLRQRALNPEKKAGDEEGDKNVQKRLLGKFDQIDSGDEEEESGSSDNDTD